METHDRFQALIVGVGAYEYFTDLPETVNDAAQLQQVLTDPLRCGYSPERVETLVESSATRSNILRGLANLAKDATGDTTTVIYFSGHGGFTRDNPSVVYLCPREANLTRMDDTAISNETFSRALAEIKTRRLVVIIDACHAGGAASFKGADKEANNARAAAWDSGLGNASQFTQYQLREGSGRIIFASSRREQQSWEYATGHMGLFTYYLIQGLTGKAPISADGTIRVFDLFHYVGRQVQAKKRTQEPVLAAQDVTMNFPIALAYGGKGLAPAAPHTQQSEFLQLRDAITQNANVGVRSFASYLRNVPVELLEAAGTERATVDFKLTQFNELDKNIRIFGSKPEWTVTRGEVIYFFIQLCLDLQRILDD